MIVLLIIDKSGAAQRRERLNKLLADGALEPGDDVADLEGELSRIAREFGIMTAVKLNRPLTGEALGAWVLPASDTVAHGLVGLTPANALYDVALDAIFIDARVVDPEELHELVRVQGYDEAAGFNGAPFLRTFAHLIFAHELSHRELHAETLGAFDSPRWSLELPGTMAKRRRQENEADELAIKRVLKAYAASKDAFALRSAGIYDIPVAHLGPEEAAGTELAAATMMACTMQFLTSTPYGPFYEDEAHPNVLSRMNHLLGSLVAETPADRDDPRQALQAVAGHLAEPVPVPGQLIAPWPIGGVAGSDDGLIVANASATEARFLRWQEIDASNRTPQMLAEVATLDLAASPKPWTPEALARQLAIHAPDYGHEMPQPGSVAALVHQSADAGVTVTIDSVQGTRTCHVSAQELTRLGWKDATVGRWDVTPRVVLLEVVGEHGAWLAVDTQSCKAERLTPDLPQEVKASWNDGQWTALELGGTLSMVWVGYDNTHKHLEAWVLDGSSKPRRTMACSPPGKHLVPWIRRMLEGEVLAALPAVDGIVVNLGAEGVFWLGLDQSAKEQRLWPVGDGVFRLMTFRNGKTVIYVEGGRKIYVTSPTAESAGSIRSGAHSGDRSALLSTQIDPCRSFFRRPIAMA